MKLNLHYDCDAKKLIYNTVYILQGESENAKTYSDEKKYMACAIGEETEEKICKRK